MKKGLIYIVIAIMTISCAKAVKYGVNDEDKRYFEAWMSVNYPNVAPSGLGIYVIDSTEGTGEVVTNEGYIIADYTQKSLEGDITDYTSAETAKQLGKYDSTHFYGPAVLLTMDETIQAGIQDAVVGMKVGGRCNFVVPSWLMTYSSYDSAEEYLKHASDYSDAIYDITITDFTTDISKWEIAKMEEYMDIHYGGYDTFDSDTTGFYYKSLSAPESDKAFGTDTTIYINYTGRRLLDGRVFDTTIEKTAKDYGLYSADKTYEPVSIRWGEKHSDLTMGTNDNSVISGFAMTLWKMKAGEKGIGIFYSPLGYSYSGSGQTIPGYCPLIFEIEIVDKPEE